MKPEIDQIVGIVNEVFKSISESGGGAIDGAKDISKVLGQSFANGVLEACKQDEQCGRILGSSVNGVISSVDPEVVNELISKLDLTPITGAIQETISDAVSGLLSDVGDLVSKTSDRFFYLTIACTAAAILTTVGSKLYDAYVESGKKAIEEIVDNGIQQSPNPDDLDIESRGELSREGEPSTEIRGVDLSIARGNSGNSRT